MESSVVPYDCIIVGAGPAGITAGIYLIRKNLDILILTLDVGGQANLSTDVENYTGFTMIPGNELVRRFEEHLNAFNVNVVNEKVKSIKKENDLFKVETQERAYWTKSVIIASGKKPRSLNVPGEEKLVGKGIFYSTLFNAPYFKDLPVAVIGGGNSAMQAILELSKFTKKIYVVNITDDLTGDEILKEKIKKMNLKIFNNSKVVEIKGENRVEGIEIENVKTKERFRLEVKGVIVLIGLVPSLDFELPNELKINERNEIDVDQNCCTNIPGLFAAGDVTDVRWKQIIIAAGEGAKAALSAHEYLMSKKEFIDEKF
ncbi:MAG: NAD(P)/FAD-dependent oxidoreductase [Candidatus Aenigmatarchaeota archaeon]